MLAKLAQVETTGLFAKKKNYSNKTSYSDVPPKVSVILKYTPNSI